MPYPTIVSAAVIRRGETLLTTQRKPDDSFPLLWEFPGGKAKPGERPDDALVRECREELGIDIRVNGIFDVVYHRYEEFSVLLLFYECDVLAGEPKVIGCHQLRFARISDLARFEFLPADRTFIDRLKRRRPTRPNRLCGPRP